MKKTINYNSLKCMGGKVTSETKKKAEPKASAKSSSSKTAVKSKAAAKVAAKATASTKKDDIYIVTTPELIYDESKRYTLADFYNGINDSTTEKVPMRVVRLEKGDIFGLTEDVLSAKPKAGEGISPAADGTWTVAAVTEASDYAKYVGVTTNNGLTYYTFEAL